MDDEIPHPLETVYEWEVVNFSMCPQSIDECLWSNPFYVDSIDVSEYQLILYPRGRTLEYGYETTLCVLDCRKESKFPINVILAANYEHELRTMVKENFLMKTGSTIELPIKRWKRPQEAEGFALLPGDSFIFRCTITLVHDHETDELDLQTLSADLGRLYMSGRHSDFCLISSEERLFPVHRVILAARCPELAKKAGIFDVEDCRECALRHVSGNAMEVFLQYLYTGVLQEHLPAGILVEICTIAVKWDLEDLERDLSPLEVCTMGRTIIPVDHQDVEWNIDGLGEKLKEGDWPLETFMDIVVGRFAASFAVVLDVSGKATAQIGLRCSRLNLSRPVTMKCVVQMVLPEHIQTLCSGEYKFDPRELDDTFRMNGNADCLLRPNQDSLTLVFDFMVSYPRDNHNQCIKVEGVNALHNPDTIWKRSLHRLSSDMDAVFRNVYEKNNPAFSDMKAKVDYRSDVPCHRCVLSARSDDLDSLIGENTRDIHMLFYGLNTVRDFFRYVYSGKFSGDGAIMNILAVYDGSFRYKIQTLKSRCLQLLPSKVDLTNLKMLLQMSDQRNDQDLHCVAVTFVQENRHSIKDTPEWAEIVKDFPCLAGDSPSCFHGPIFDPDSD